MKDFRQELGNGLGCPQITGEKHRVDVEGIIRVGHVFLAEPNGVLRAMEPNYTIP